MSTTLQVDLSHIPLIYASLAAGIQGIALMGISLVVGLIDNDLVGSSAIALWGVSNLAAAAACIYSLGGL